MRVAIIIFLITGCVFTTKQIKQTKIGDLLHIDILPKIDVDEELKESSIT
jgi:hypothetical protein